MRVRAVLSTALNPVYYKLAKLLPTVFRAKPLILEGDLAGRVVEPNGHPFKVGDGEWRSRTEVG